MDELDVLALGGDGLPKEEPPRTLVELINRVLDRGVVVGGDVTISLAGVDLVYLGLNALLTSVSTARETLGREVGTGRLGPRTSGPEGTGAASPKGPEPWGQGGQTGSRRTAIDGRQAGRASGEAGKRPRDAEATSRAAPRSQATVAGPHSLPVPAPPLTGKRESADENERPDVAAPPPGDEGERKQGDPVQVALAEVARTLPDRIDVDPEAVQRDLAQLVLTLVELLRRVVEHQAIRRMDDPDLSDAQIERMGIALQRLDEKLAEIRGLFGLAEGDLDVDLGPLGKLF